VFGLLGRSVRSAGSMNVSTLSHFDRHLLSASPGLTLENSDASLLVIGGKFPRNIGSDLILVVVLHGATDGI
jgi:hypothetical protein